VAVGTRGWRRRVKEDLLAVYLAEKLVAAGAGDIAVLAFQGELSPLVVIEERRLPFGRVVAVATWCDLVRIELRELPAVDIFMALLALLRRLLEVHIDELGFQVWRLVAIDAGDRAMRARQWKRRRAVIKAVQLFPRLSGVAGLAAHRLPVLADLVHALLELSMMHVFMAARARQVFKVVANFGFRLILIRELVAIAAGHRQVPACQLEFRLLMLRKREGRGAVSLQVMTLVALVVVRLAGELVVVLVHVAISALLEFRDLEDRVLPLGRVALIALHLGMPID